MKAEVAFEAEAIAGPVFCSTDVDKPELDPLLRSPGAELAPIQHAATFVRNRHRTA